jgi:UDP-N-acetylmuramate dehydrogenase
MAGELGSRVSGRVATDEPLGPQTTFRAGGAADVFVEAETVDDLHAVAEVVAGRMPVAVVGRGSNLLVSDDGFRGVAVKLGRGFRRHDRTDDGFVFGGALYLPAAAKLTAQHGLAGFEFAAEIPGAFGGAVRMNAGAHGRSMADVLVWTRTVDLRTGELETLTVDELGYGYRHSSLRAEQVVADGQISLRADEPAAVAGRIAEHLAWRRSHQPPGLSCGSVFKNPPGDAAGRLIEAAGLKGFRIGGAEVSVVHANFIVVDRDAKASDVWNLITHVRETVRASAGVVLEPEVRFLGAFTQVEPSSNRQVEG